MSLSTFSLASLRNQKKAKSMFIHTIPEIEIDTSFIKQIGNYRLGEEIGSGAFGKVILGLHIITGEKVAIKILDKFILSQTPEDYELVRQELSILKIVKHKYIVQLYEILETPQHIFIIMEYCEGQDIMDYILTKGHLSEEESLKYFQQLINALYYLHSQNITHRDIKIDNLLLDKNSDLKLIDFGLSTKYRDDRLLNQPCGTVVYAAPEVLDCKEYHGMLADVWSSGIVLFGMLSGFLPFGDSNDEVNKKLVLQGKIEMPNFFSKEVIDLLRHMLDINPLSRYTLEEIMAHPWFNKKQFKLIPGIIIGINRIPVDERIINLCVTYNVDRNKVRNSVINNKFNNESALYYLLVKKLKNCGNDSVSDLCSNKFIKYIIEETNRIDYLNEIKNKLKIEINNSNNNKNFNNNNNENNIRLTTNQKETSKDKKNEKEKFKIISQLNEYINNLNGKENEIDLSAAPGLINDNNSNNKKTNLNLINIENNYSSNNNSKNYEENFGNYDIINMNLMEKDNFILDEIKLRINSEDNECIKNGEESRNNQEGLNKKNINENYSTQIKGKLDPTKAISKNEKLYLNINKNRNLLDEEKEKEKDIENQNNKSSTNNNNKRIEKYIYYNRTKYKLNDNQNKHNINKKNSKKIQDPPLTSRNEYSKNKNNDISCYNMNIPSTQILNMKKKSKIVPISKDLFKKINLKNSNNKDNITKIIFKQNNIYDKKEFLTKDFTKKLNQYKNNIPIINIPPLNINTNSKKAKKSYKKDSKDRKHQITHLYENNNEIYNKLVSNFNKIKDSRNKLYTQRNNDISGNIFKTIYHSKNTTNSNNNTSYLKNNEKNVILNGQNNLKQFFKNKLNSKSNENRKKFITNSLSKDKKINKTNVMNLLDNFHLYQSSKKTNKKKNLNSSNKNSSNNKSNFNKTIISNNNSKYNCNKKDFNISQPPLLTIEYNNHQDDLNKNNGFKTDRTKNILNLKKQSYLDKENINYINNNKSNYNKIKYKKIINNNISNNHNSHMTIKLNQNELIKIKIKDFYLKRKKLDNLNIKETNSISYTFNGSKTNNSLVQNSLNNNYNNNLLSTKNKINSSIINADKSNSSRINITLKNKSIKDKNNNKIYKKINSISSIKKLKIQGKQKVKYMNSKKFFTENNNKINSLLKIGFVPNYKIKANLSLSNEKNKNINKNNNTNNNTNIKNIKKTYQESSVIVYRKKSPFKIRDLSDSPKQKFLNEKTRSNRIPWKIKKKGIDDKLDSFSIYNRYMNQFKSNNPFKKRNLLKKKFKNNKKEKSSFYLNHSKIKNNKISCIPNSSNQKISNISYTNYEKNNNLFLKDKDNNNEIIQNINHNGTSHEFYKYDKIQNINHISININNEHNNMNMRKKDIMTSKYKKLKLGKKLKILNFVRRNEKSINYHYETFLTQPNENIMNLRDNNTELKTTKNINLNINNKKQYNKSISFGSFQPSNNNEDIDIKNYDFEAPFDLSCLFITKRKVSDCFAIIRNKMKKYGINLSLKNNIIVCNKNSWECQISVLKFNNGKECLLKDKRNNDKNIICYKAIDKKNRNNIIYDIFSKLIINSN